MSTAELDRLEHDVEAARARLVGDMSRLRADTGASDMQRWAKTEIADTKDELIGKAKNAARHQAQGVVENIQARIAANPAAALAIGAGLAWRLYRHPPVATILVGAGLMSLARTDPHQPPLAAGMRTRAVGYADSARRTFRDVSMQASDLAHDAKARVGELAETAGDSAGDLADAAREKATGARHSAANALRQAGRRADRWTADGKRAVSRATAELEPRDGVLLGAAALAIAAAVGIAAQRRSSEKLAAPAVMRTRPNTQTRRSRQLQPVG